MNKEIESTGGRNESRTRGMSLGRALLIFFLLILAAAGLFYITQFKDVALKPASETTMITGPLDSGGRVDFLKSFEEINFSADVASEKNGFRLIVENVNFFDDIPGSHFGVVCPKLGLDPESTQPKLKYEDPYEFVSIYFKSGSFDESLVLKVEKSLEHTLGQRPEEQPLQDWDVGEILVTPTIRPWTGKELPMMETWVTENSPALDLYAKAIRMSVFDIPFGREDNSKAIYETVAYHVQILRSVARGFVTRANYYVGQGEMRKAIDDIVSCKRLGRHVCNRNTLIDRLTGITIESMADSIGIVKVDDDQLTKEELEYFSSELKAIPERTELNRAVYHEKLAQMDWLQRGAHRENDRWMDDTLTARHLRNMGLDWNVVLAEFSQTFDRLWQDREVTIQPEIKLGLMDFISRAARSRKFALWYTRINAGIAVIDADQRAICGEKIRKITIAMLRYEKDHGTLPPAYTTGKDGKPLHSWRVLLLPYLGEQELYNKLKLDEAWDSSHNSKFESECPSVFACPACPQCGSSKTSYSVILGDEFPFESNVGKKLSEFGPHSNDMILVAERTQPVNWMDPTNEISESDAIKGIKLDYANNDAPLPMGSNHTNGSNFGCRNGASIIRHEQNDVEILKNLLKGKNQKIIP